VQNRGCGRANREELTAERRWESRAQMGEQGTGLTESPLLLYYTAIFAVIFEAYTVQAGNLGPSRSLTHGEKEKDAPL